MAGVAEREALKAALRRRKAHQAALAAVLERESVETIAEAVRAIDECLAHEAEDSLVSVANGLPVPDYEHDRVIRAALAGGA